MSSFDPLRRGGDAAPTFGPLPAAIAMPGALARRGGVFTAFDTGMATTRAADEHVAASAAAESEAVQTAYAAGVTAGRAAALQEGVASAQELAAAIQELARFRAGLVERYERELLELALGVARKVVQRELADNPEHWLAMLREAVRLTLDRDTIRIRVGGVLHRFLLDHLPDLRARLEDVKELELVEDGSLGDTGCVVESRYGELDLGIDGQIEAIRAALTSAG